MGHASLIFRGVVLRGGNLTIERFVRASRRLLRAALGGATVGKMGSSGQDGL